MYLSGRLSELFEYKYLTAWNDRGGIFLIVDMSEMRMSIHPIGEGLVANLVDSDEHQYRYPHKGA
jgi:hypothetical protein